MAKKVVAGQSKGAKQKFVKIVRAVKNDDTGGYTFREEIVSEEEAKKAKF